MYMTYDSFEDFQYDSCTSRGLCSINPRTSALQGVLLLFLKLSAKYILKLYKKGLENEIAKQLVLNTIAIAVSNPEFTENSFISSVQVFKRDLPGLIEKYNEVYGVENQEDENFTLNELFENTGNITEAIRFGEKIFRKAVEQVPAKIRDLYQIMLVITKSLSINLLDLESFDKKYEKAFLTILETLNSINIEERDVEKLVNSIYEAAKTDNQLMQQLRNAQEQRYGRQKESEVSYTTTPSKAVLVVGSNIRELETVLENLKNEDIDIYTHDDMMLAHTFPKFSEYSHLKGQYGQGLENCLLDFATFPGPIILTKHSLHNIENFYRGRLFTTDSTCPTGVITIKDNDFSQVIESASNAKGFKTGKQCETVTIGYDFEKTIQNIKSKLDSKKYDKIFMIGLERYSLEQKTYFEKLIKLTPENILIISFSYNIERENLTHINTCFDSYSLIRVFDSIKDYTLPVTVFMPKCDRHTISEMVYLCENPNTEVFVGKCTPIILNPSLMNTLKSVFEINSITSAKKDLETISHNS